jgi:hypothetical protein
MEPLILFGCLTALGVIIRVVLWAFGPFLESPLSHLNDWYESAGWGDILPKSRPGS